MALAILYLSSYVAAVAAFLFVTLSLASGLLWLAEVIEEHSRLAKVIGQRAIWAIIAFHLILIFDALPIPYLLFSIFCHIVYSRNMTPQWPSISLTSPVFMLSCILVLVDHFMWFIYFSNQHHLARQRSKSYGYRGGSYSKNSGLHGPENDRSFSEIATFFAICVWTTPLFLFLSLSANDNTLPVQGSTSDESTRAYTGSSQQSLLRRMLNPVLSLLPTLRRKKRDDGLIAPPSPLPYPPSPGIQSSYTTNDPYGAQAGLNSPGLNQLGGSWSSVMTNSRSGSPAPPLAASGKGAGTGLGIGSSDPVLMGSPPVPRVRRVVSRKSGDKND